MASDSLYVSPDTPCSYCSRKLNNGYLIIYKEDNTKQYICDICGRVAVLDDYKKSGIISTKLLMEASMADYRFNNEFYTTEQLLSQIRPEIKEFLLQNKNTLLEINVTNKKAQELTTAFEGKHWVPYLKKYWNKSSHRGHQAKVDDVTVLMWGSAGRVLVTCRREDQDVTMIFSDYKESDTLCGGVQGVNGTKETIIEILNTVVSAEKLKFKHKEDVTIL